MRFLTQVNDLYLFLCYYKPIFIHRVLPPLRLTNNQYQPTQSTGLIMPETKTTTKFFVIFPLLLLVAIIISEPTGAETVTGCHCFRQRSYDPEAKFVADDYILATSFNSLTANLFSISKKQIIMLKMRGGTHQNDLLIALKLGHDFGLDHQQLLNLRKKDYSWQQIIAQSKTLSEIKDNALLTMIKSGKPVNDLGQKVADSMIADFYDVPEKEIEKLKALGFNEKEMALFFLLVRYKQVKPEELVKQVKNEGQSWSEVAHKLEITPAMAGQLIANYGK